MIKKVVEKEDDKEGWKMKRRKMKKKIVEKEGQE